MRCIGIKKRQVKDYMNEYVQSYSYYIILFNEVKNYQILVMI